MVRVPLPMPDNYVHVHALVFALFGKRSVEDMRDPDLDLAHRAARQTKNHELQARTGRDTLAIPQVR